RRLRERIADAIPQLVYVYDLRARRMRLVNCQITTMLGYPQDAVQGTEGPLFGELLHPEDVAVRDRQQADLAAVGEGFLECEYRVRHANGAYRWLHCRETVFTRTPEGEPWEIMGTADDITDRKRLGQLLATSVVEPKAVGKQLQQFRE